MRNVSVPVAGKGRVVRHTRPDGTIKEYHYPAYEAPPAPIIITHTVADPLGEVMEKWQRSPEWRGLARGTQDIYVRAMVDLRGMTAVPIAQITKPMMMDQRNAIADDPKRGAGAARCFVIGVSALFSFASHYGIAIAVPNPAIGLARGLIVGELPAWTEADYQLATKHLPEYLRRVVVLARFTGQRRSDLIKMLWSDYDGTTIRVTQQKTKVPLKIPAGPQLKAELAAWRGLPAQPIVTRPNGMPWVGANVSKVLGRELDKIDGFPKGRNLHGLRKLTAVALAMAGATPHQIMSITGHKSIGMVQHYTKDVDQERLASGVHLFLEIPAGG